MPAWSWQRGVDVLLDQRPQSVRSNQFTGGDPPGYRTAGSVQSAESHAVSRLRGQGGKMIPVPAGVNVGSVENMISHGFRVRSGRVQRATGAIRFLRSGPRTEEDP
jgi:hypothetical protein